MRYPLGVRRWWIAGGIWLGAAAVWLVATLLPPPPPAPTPAPPPPAPLTDAELSAEAIRIRAPRRVAEDRYRHLLIACPGAHRVLKLQAGGGVVQAAGNGSACSGTTCAAEGRAIDVPLTAPADVAPTPDGGFLVVDSAACRVAAVDVTGALRSVVGPGCGGGGDGGPPEVAHVDGPAGVALGLGGAILVAERAGCRIRRIIAGRIETLAGTGHCGTGGDGGPATSASLLHPSSVAAASDGTILFAEMEGRRIRAVDEAGIIRTLAGRRLEEALNDGPGPLSEPAAVVRSAGRALVADAGLGRILAVGSDGQTHPVAGTGTAGCAGDGGPATAAQLRRPSGVWVDSSGRVLIADTGNDAIRVIDPAGRIWTLVGGRPGCSVPPPRLSPAEEDRRVKQLEEAMASGNPEDTVAALRALVADLEVPTPDMAALERWIGELVDDPGSRELLVDRFQGLLRRSPPKEPAAGGGAAPPP